MKAKIVNFRMSRHRTTGNHMILSVETIDSKQKAEALVGKGVVFTTTGGKEIKGKIASTHGNSGALRAIFERGMPGQAIAKDVVIA